MWPWVALVIIYLLLGFAVLCLGFNIGFIGNHEIDDEPNYLWFAFFCWPIVLSLIFAFQIIDYCMEKGERRRKKNNVEKG
jgi:hypothetical protein